MPVFAMPPKKVVEPPKSYPDVEEEVQLPEEVEPVPQPEFCLAVGRVFGHTFKVRPPASSEAEDDGAQEAAALELFDFDPEAVLLQRAQAPAPTQDELLAKRVAVVSREELVALSKGPEGEELPLTTGLRIRLEKEREARQRAKLNAARRKAIADHEAAKAAAEQAQAEDAPPPGEPEEQAEPAEQRPQADFLLLTLNYPSTVDEVREMASAGLCTQGVVDVWATVYLAGVGKELDEEERANLPADQGGESDVPPLKAFDPPEMVRDIYEVIQAAPTGSELSTSTVCTIRDAHELAFPPEGVEQVDMVQDAVLTALGEEALSLQRYRSWTDAATKVTIPDLDPRLGETRLYHRMMSSVDASHHDVPLFLHCLTEQVSRTLGGEAERHEAELAIGGLMEYFGNMGDAIISDGQAAPPRPKTGSSRSPSPRPDRRRRGDPPAQPKTPPAAIAPSELPVVSYCDRTACAHLLGTSGSAAVVEGASVADAAREVIDQVRVFGAHRQGMPRDALYSAEQREAMAHRIYPFAPQVSPVDLEQFMLLHAFEELMCRSQPERSHSHGWNLSGRTFRERVPGGLLPQVLQAAMQNEAFVSSTHIPRCDALLVALHYRSPAGRVMWHAWRGDLRTEAGDERWQEGLFPTPSYNDWAQVFGGRSGEAPQPRYLLEGIHSRELGYSALFEKLATPSDGSVIIVTRSELGLSHTFPAPSNEPPANDDGGDSQAERQHAMDDGASSATGITLAAKHPDPAAKLRSARCEVPPAKSARMARIIKDGHTFGIVPDRSFDAWREAETRRRAEAAAAMAAAAAEAAGAAAEAATAADAPEEAPQAAEAAAQAAAAAAEEAKRASAGVFKDASLGSLWLAFPSGARCTARMHHERALRNAGPKDDALPRMGVLLTYTTSTGQVIQVSGDGSVCLSLPLELCEGTAPPAIPADAEDDEAPEDASPGGPGQRKLPGPPKGNKKKQRAFAPGCAEDVEVSRTVTPHGVVCRRLLSGRAEVHHPDGTSAWRNPTAEEVVASLGDLKRRPGGAAEHVVEVLERLAKACVEKQSKPLTEPPSERAKSEGIPGHWVVVRPDGRVLGRAAAPPPPPSAPAPPAPTEEAAPEAEQAVAGGEQRPGSCIGAAAPEPPAPSLQELLGAVLVDGGAVLEYEIQSVPTAIQEDLMTKHRATTNAIGTASFADPHGLQQISVHGDGSQITTTKREGGRDIEVLKEPYAFIRCDISDGAIPRAIVECADGATIEVEPSEDTPEHFFDPGMPELPPAAARARVTVSTRNGAKVMSSGDGQVEVLTRPGGVEKQGGCYTAFCHEGRVVLLGARAECEADAEAEGHFELLTDQSLRVPSPRDPFAGGDGESAMAVLPPPASPRCRDAGKAYRWNGTELLKAPEMCHPPRLFVIYGDGEAEELIEADDARRLLAEAEEDPNAVVLEGPEMGECKSRTVFRQRQADANVVPPIGSLALPEAYSVGGSSCYSVLEGCAGRDAPKAPAHGISECRQFLEFPEISEEAREQFKGTLKQYRDWEALQLSRSRFAMMGPDTSKGKKDAKRDRKAADDKRDKKGKKGKKNVVVEVQEEPEEKPPDPAFVQDFKISAFEHSVQVLKMRAAAAKAPDGEERMKFALEARKTIDQDGSAMADEGPMSYAVKVANIDFEKLCARPELLEAVREAVKLAFAQQAGEGVMPDDITIDLSAGSLVVEATIDASPSAAEALRQAPAADVGAAIAAAVAAVPGIEEVASGDVFAASAGERASAPSSPVGSAASPLNPGGVGRVTTACFGVDAPAGDQALPEFASGSPTPCGADDADAGLEGSGDGDELVEAGDGRQDRGIGDFAAGQQADVKKPKMSRDPIELCFKYFDTDTGAKFLEESGEANRPRPTKSKDVQRTREIISEPEPSPWNPRLVGQEPEEEEEPPAQEYEERRLPAELDRFPAPDEAGGYYNQGTAGRPMMGQPQTYVRGMGPPIEPEVIEAPPGPHPDKKGVKWDHRGELRPQKPPVSQAYMEINTKYLEVEGATDRRVRTSSISHKKNAARAPSVQEVRKVGTHAVGRGTTRSAKDILGDGGEAVPEEHWKLTSSMQGLGDSNNLVEVMPGACRFGPLCLGKVYRMSFYIRNLDVDVMRYVVDTNATQPESWTHFVKICHTPGELVGDANKIAGHLAPGMAKKVIVEIAAHKPDKIEKLITITMKAHRIQVPVFARILDVEEYEKEDYTEMAIRNRHIGRAQEHGAEASGGKPPPVEQVSDPSYVKKVFDEIKRKRDKQDKQDTDSRMRLPPIHNSGYPPHR